MPYSVKSLLEVDEVMVEVLLMVHVLLYDDTAVEDLLNCATPSSEARLFFCEQFFCLTCQSLQEYSEHDLAGVRNEADGPVVLALAEISFLG